MSAVRRLRWGMLPCAAMFVPLGVACSGRAEPPCPSGHHRDPARASAIVDALGSVDEGAALLPRLAETQGICFSPEAVDVVTTDRFLLLAIDLDPGEAAARLGHLLVHVRDGLPMHETIPPGADCTALVAEALDREAVAYATEIRLQRALDAHPRAHRFEITDRVAMLPPELQVRELRAYLEAHPRGAPGIDGLATGYLERCERER